MLRRYATLVLVWVSEATFAALRRCRESKDAALALHHAGLWCARVARRLS
jgi:hypothetical protein